MTAAIMGQTWRHSRGTAPGRVLVVGAGFAGAVYARELAEAGYAVDVIDKRDHIAGNAFDEVSETGVRVHRYGPHLLHTNNEMVVEWLRRFTAFAPYEHRVKARLADGRHVPLPINRTTVNTVFDVSLESEAEMRRFLAGLAVRHPKPANAAQYLQSQVGAVLTDLFFRPYTRKMWAMELEEIDASIVKRIPLRYDDESRYFPDDRFQFLPRDGYTQMFSAILDHPRIAVQLSRAFDDRLAARYDQCFNSMPIDEYFDYRFGPLPYRSIRFHHRRTETGRSGAAATVNFTDDGPLTRETDWSWLPGDDRADGPGLVTAEEPCGYEENAFERYYPVKTADGRHQATYRRYAELAEANPAMTFIGRCGTYQYLDMHQVINQSLRHARDWIRTATCASGR